MSKTERYFFPIGIEHRCALLALLFDTVLEILLGSVRYNNNNKDTQFGKEIELCCR